MMKKKPKRPPDLTISCYYSLLKEASTNSCLIVIG